MSARPDIRQISLTSATGPPSGAPAPSSVTGPPGGPNGPASHPHHNIYAQRHPINQRPGSAYMPINLDGSPGKNLRGVHPGSSAIQVTGPPPGLGGRSGSPANGPGSTAPAAAANLIRQPYTNYPVASAVAQTANHRAQGPSVDHVRSYYQVAATLASAANSSLPAVAASIGQSYPTARDPAATVFVRNPIDRIPTSASDMGRTGSGNVHPPASVGSSSSVSQGASSGRMTLRPYHPPQQTLYPSDVSATYLRDPGSLAAAAVSGSGRDLGPTLSAVHQNLHPSLHPGVHPASLPSRVAPSAGPSSITHTGASGGLPEVRPMAKRPRMDMGGPIHHQGGPHVQPPPHAQSAAHGSHHQSSSALTPLRIDTRETVKDSGYHPQVEAISPTGPEASGERDELRSTKDDLLQKITKVDREIAKAESQIAKLKKKQQELEDTTSKPLSDTNEEEEKPRNQSIAQVVYAENRKKARSSHLMLEKFAGRRVLGANEGGELPMYNQPSDTNLYHVNKRNHTYFKRVLVERFKKRNEDKETREKYMTETYTRMMATWTKKVEKIENSKRRKEREAKGRELYEKNFPELRKQREDKERDHRLGTRGAVRSEADIEDVIERLQEQEMEDKKMHSYAVIPPLLLPPDERRRKFTNNNGLVLDPLREYNERKFVNTWTDAEKEIFKEKYLLHPKTFGQIAQFLERKTVSDCVQYYYLSKKTENYKQLLRKSTKVRRGGRNARSVNQAGVIGENSSGVLTRNRNKESAPDNARDNGDSNRSTPNMKHDPKDESKDEEEKKTNKGKDSRNDTSDEDDGSQQVKSGPHSCSVCKATVDKSRTLKKSLAQLLGLRDEDTGSGADSPRVCNSCYVKAQRKKHAHCPIPTCTSTKGRNKGRLRHMPGKWMDLSKDIQDIIANEFQIPEGTTKCCSACLTRLTRKITQLTGSTENHKSRSEERLEQVLLWREDEIEILKGCLRSNGKNWSVMSEMLNKSKSPEQCKKFFYSARKKHQLDKIVLEYKRANQTGDQPPTLSTDEESGSSTSSCDEDAGLPHNSNLSSGRNSPSRRTNSAGTANDIKPPIKVENNGPTPGSSTTNNPGLLEHASSIRNELKAEIKNEDKVDSIHIAAGGNPILVAKGIMGSSQGIGRIHTTSIGSSGNIKEEEYDSSATMSADEGTAETSRGPPNHVQGYIVHSSPSTIYPHHQLGGQPPSASHPHTLAGPSLSLRPVLPNPSDLLMRAGHPLPPGSHPSLGLVSQGGATLVRNPPNLHFASSQDTLRNKPPNIYHQDIRHHIPPPTSTATSMRPPQHMPPHSSSSLLGQAQVLHHGGAAMTNGPASQILTVKDLMINVIEKSLCPTKGNGQGGGSTPGNGGGQGPSLSAPHLSNPSEGQGLGQVPPPSPTIHNLLANSGPPPHKTNYIRDRIGLNPLQQQQTHTSSSQSTASHPKPPPSMQFAAINAGIAQQQAVVQVGTQQGNSASGKKILVNGPQSMAPPAAPSLPPSSTNDCETLDLSMPSRRRDPTPPPSQSQQSQQGGYREPNYHSRNPRSSPAGDGYTSQPLNCAPPPAHSSKASTAPDPYLRAPNDNRQAPSPVGHLPDRRLATPPSHHMSSRQSPGLVHGRPASAQLPARHSDIRPGSTGGVQYTGGIPRQLGPSPQPQVMKNPPLSPRLLGKIDRPLTINTGSITQGTPMSQIPAGLPGSSRGYDHLLKLTPTDKAPTGSIIHGTPVYEKKHPAIVTIADMGGTKSGTGFSERSMSSDMYRRSTVSPSSGYPGYPSSSTIVSTAATPSGQGASRAYASEPHLSSRQVIINDYAMARSADMQRRPESREYLPRQLSPPRLSSSRDPSPRPRSSLIVTDPRAAQLDIRSSNSSRDIVSRSDPRYDHRLDPRMMGDPKAEMRSLEHRSESRTSLHDVRGDPRIGLDPRGDPRAGLEIRPDQRTSLDPRAPPDHRTDIRLQTHDSRRGDGRPSSSGIIDRDPRIIVDPRSADHRLDPRASTEHRIDHGDSRRSASYYGHQQPQQQTQQIYLSSDGKYVAHSLPSRDIPRNARSPLRTTPPPPISARTSANLPPAATIHQRPSLTSGKPIVSKSVASVSAGIPHREVEIYRTHPEVTISKTNSPRHAYNDQNPLASLVDVAIQQPKLPDIKGDREGRGALLSSSSSSAPSSASIHYQHSRHGGISQVPPTSAHLYDPRSRYDLHDVDKGRRDGPNLTSADLARDRSYAGSTSASSQGVPHDPSQLVQQVHAERSKQQYFLLQGERAATNQAAVAQSAPPGSSARLATSAERTKSVIMNQLPRSAVTNSITSNQVDSPAVIVNEQSVRLGSAAASSRHPLISSQSPLSVARVSDAGEVGGPNSGGSRTISAATVIDAIITHAINSGTPPDGGILPPGASIKQLPQFRRSPVSNLPSASSSMTIHPMDTALDNKVSPYKPPSRSPSVKSDGTNGPTDADGHVTAPGSRPGSRSSSGAEQSIRPVTLGEHMDHIIGKDLQIQPTTSAPPTSAIGGSRPPIEMTAQETYWKRNRVLQHNPTNPSVSQSHQNSPSHPPSSTNSRVSMVSGNGSASGNNTTDERQITRVAQSPSPKSQTASSIISGNPRVEAISPPTGGPESSDGTASIPQQRTPPASSATGDPISRFIDARKRPVNIGSQQSSQQQQSLPAGSTAAPVPEGKGGAPGLSPLDYVKNKIVEEMKKVEGSGSTSVSVTAPTGGGSNQIAAGVKRQMSAQEENSTKRLCPNTQIPSNATSDLPPDSPGSEGEMVIDESARPDSVSSHKTASPAPNQITPIVSSVTSISTSIVGTSSTTSSASNIPINTNARVVTSNVTSNSLNASSGSPQSNNTNSSARYDNVSDDE